MESTVTFAGTVKSSLTTMFVAAMVPLFVTVTVYVRLPVPDPACTGSTDSTYFGNGNVHGGRRGTRRADRCRVIASVGFRLIDSGDRGRVADHVGAGCGRGINGQRYRQGHSLTRIQIAKRPGAVRCSCAREGTVADVDIDQCHAARQREVFAKHHARCVGQPTVHDRDEVRQIAAARTGNHRINVLRLGPIEARPSQPPGQLPSRFPSLTKGGPIEARSRWAISTDCMSVRPLERSNPAQAGDVNLTQILWCQPMLDIDQQTTAAGQTKVDTPRKSFDDEYGVC